MTSFNEVTFFHADFNQTEVEDSFQLPSDWIKSEQKKKRSDFWAPCRNKDNSANFLGESKLQ